jgi:WhiB family transcriptional regulator, redox-sensing transcriptional regulator
VTAVMPWADGAPCREKPALFYPDEAETRGAQYDATKQAKAICRRCPVLQDCARWALSRPEQFGIWGGMTPNDRTRVLDRERKRAERARDLLLCGAQAAAA